MKIKQSLVLSLALSAFCAAPFAEEAKGPNVGEKPKAAESSSSAQAIQSQVLARQLANLGMETQDPLALIVAARIIRENPAGELDATKKEGESVQESDQLGSADYLLGQAKEFSGGRAEVLALVDEVEKMAASKGTSPVFRDRYDSVRSGHTDVWTINFEGGELAQVGVDTNCSGDCIDCYAYDEYGNQVESDTDYTGTCLLLWSPRWTGPFEIHIENRTSSRIGYELMTN